MESCGLLWRWRCPIFQIPDTLTMAMPVSWKSVVEQYAGRLNRDYEGKESVIIYDYVDSHISMFEKMYHKRLKAYKQIGYDICTGNAVEKQNAMRSRKKIIHEF